MSIPIGSNTTTEEKSRIHIERVESEFLRGNALGDPTTRDLYIYLPPTYDRDLTHHFPVIYCLTGFTGRGQMLLNTQAFTPNLAERIDSLIERSAVAPMIVVMPDCFTRLGGSQYINSTATGRYEDYLVNEIVPFVDHKFRTRTEAAGRAVMGKSSGGYGALVHGMRHANVFGAVASHSGDCYFEYCYLPDFAKTFRALKQSGGDVATFIERFWNEEKKERDAVAALNIIAMSACYSPETTISRADVTSPGFQLPFDTTTGEVNAAVWAHWLTHDPVRMVEQYAENLKSLKLLYLDAGTRDEYALDLGARVLAARLREHGIRFTHEEFDDGHFNISYRYDRSLTLLSEAMNDGR